MPGLSVLPWRRPTSWRHALLHHRGLKAISGRSRTHRGLGCFLDELNLITRLEHDNIMRTRNCCPSGTGSMMRRRFTATRPIRAYPVRRWSITRSSLRRFWKDSWRLLPAESKARRISGEICPTYFTYEVPEYEKLRTAASAR